MIETDMELKAWWRNLSEVERNEIFETMEEKSENPDFAQSLKNWWTSKKWLSPKQIAAIKKWST